MPIEIKKPLTKEQTPRISREVEVFNFILQKIKDRKKPHHKVKDK